jgi:hypothetical protein
MLKRGEEHNATRTYCTCCHIKTETHKICRLAAVYGRTTKYGKEKRKIVDKDSS